MAARFAGYTQEEYERLPGSRRWVDGYGDCKAGVLVRYRIHCYTEALQSQELREANKPKGKAGKR